MISPTQITHNLQVTMFTINLGKWINKKTQKREHPLSLFVIGDDNSASIYIILKMGQ